MLTHAFAGPWTVRLATLALWALAGAGALFWALALPRPLAALAPVAQEPGAALDTPAVARLLGAGALAPLTAAAPGPAPASRFVLQGVLAGQASGGGAALISVDGQPARPYRVGAALEAGLVVQSLSRRAVHLGPQVAGAATLVLQMPLKP